MMPRETKRKNKSQIKIDRLRHINVVLLVAVIVLSSVIVGMYLKSNGNWLSSQNGGSATTTTASSSSSGALAPSVNFTAVEGEVLPAQGAILPAKWGDAAKKLVDSGALNETALESAVKQSGQTVTPEEFRILSGTSTGNIILNSSDSAFVLYVLWGIGINNNNTIINNGPLAKYGGNPDQFASTGGYAPLGKLYLGDLYLVNLTANEQIVANYTAENTYRPCCNNPAMFPDCNHGAAALGLIELMASQGNNVTATFGALKAFNSFQYPQQYIEMGVYLKSRGIDFNSVPASIILSANASSATGMSTIENYLKTNNIVPSSNGSGSSCSA